MNHSKGHAHEAVATVGHVVRPPLLLAVALCLVALTWITVAVTYVNLGPLNLWIALIIASIKAALVLLYFMHLRWDRPFNVVVLLTSIVFLLLFIGPTLSDTSTYRHEVEWRPAEFYSHPPEGPAMPPAAAAPAGEHGK